VNKLVPYLVSEPTCDATQREVCSFGVKAAKPGAKQRCIF
jgi:hypothetical protein